VIALIDGDLVVYQCAFKGEDVIDWGDSVSVTANVPTIHNLVNNSIESTAEAVRADSIIVCLTDSKNNFRRAVYPGYKEKRRRTARAPIGLNAAKRYIRETFEVMERPTLEADDILGILATGNIAALKGERVVCSIDKDMLTIPGLHYNWWNHKGGVREIGEGEADLAFFTQILTGDATDNYAGVPGMGPVGASKILAEFFDAESDLFDEVGAWEAVVAAYAGRGFNEEYALSMARCARILRASDYNFKRKEPRLWTPPEA
jgi:DNA polymerase-1